VQLVEELAGGDAHQPYVAARGELGGDDGSEGAALLPDRQGESRRHPQVDDGAVDDAEEEVRYGSEERVCARPLILSLEQAASLPTSAQNPYSVV
jgi:hypothetical protein